jgi:hypothetical protein
MTQAGLARFNEPNFHPGTQTFGLKVGKVVGFNYQDHTIDVILSDGSPYQHIPLLEMWAGTDYGDTWNPQYDVTDAGLAVHPGESGSAAQTARDAYAVISFFEGVDSLPICLGFFYPEISQMMFGMQRLTRHVGDSFAAVTFNGTHYLAFDKDGTAISLNQGDPHPPIVHETDFDTLSRPKIGGYSITLITASGSKVNLDGISGDITIEGKADVSISASGTLALSGSPLTLDGLVGVYF